MRPVGVALSLVAPAVVLLAGCAINPVSGRPEATVMSEAKEREIGEEEARKVAETMGLVEHPALTAYVRAVGERLARFSPRTDVTYTFHIVEMQEPNAFALPGGPVYVSRGLLALLNSEDELAGVLGHEIGHIAARHAVRRVTRGAPLAILTGIGATAVGIVSPTLGGVVGGLGSVASAALLAPYSRDQEREADRVGQDIAARAGWDPTGLSRSLDTLAREEALAGNRGGASFFATHPALPDRVGETEKHAATLTRGAPAPIAHGRDAFVRRLDGLVVGHGAAEGVFEGETFLHPDLDVHLRFPSGWKTVNARDAVGASAPDGRAVVALEMVGEGSDTVAAIEKFTRETGADLGAPERVTVGGQPATHATTVARTREGRIALDLTWIAHAGHVYRITGASSPSTAEAMRGAFRETAGSFRPLTAGERASIREARVRLLPARPGESLATVAARVQGPWTVPMTAVANGVPADAPLRDITLVKAAVLESYAPARR